MTAAKTPKDADSPDDKCPPDFFLLQAAKQYMSNTSTAQSMSTAVNTQEKVNPSFFNDSLLKKPQS